YSSKKDDRAPTDVLPDVLEHHHGLECRWIPHEIQRWQTMTGQHVVHESVTAQDRGPDAHQYHPANEIWQVDDRLNRALCRHVYQAVQQQCEPDGGWEIEDDLQPVDNDRVDEGIAHRGICQQGREVVETDPAAPEEAEVRRVVF